MGGGQKGESIDEHNKRRGVVENHGHPYPEKTRRG